MLDKTDIPAALDNLDQRLTTLETAAPASADNRVDVLYSVLERYFGKEIADEKAARNAAPVPNPAPTAQPAPSVSAGAPQPAQVTAGPVAGQ